MPEHHNHAARPICQGIYALLHDESSRQTHLVYILTIPDEPDELQKEFGIQEKKGSYVLSVRNPETPAPPSVGVSKKPEFSKEILDEFHGRRWMPALPKHLDIENAQILFVGAKSGKIINPDGSQGEKIAEEILEELKVEDEERIKSLEGDHTIFEDLELSMKEYKEIKRSWDE